MSARAAVIVFAAITVASSAKADRGAVTTDIGGGIQGVSVPTPYWQGPRSTLGMAALLTAGGRYALRNWLEVSISGFFSFPNGYWHDHGEIQTPGGAVPGSLEHSLMTYGAAVGARLVRGEELRLVAGFELGWAHRAYSNFTPWNDVNPADQHPYPLTTPLPDVGVDNLLLSPMAGVEWNLGDHYSVSFLPRFQMMVGAEMTFAVLLPVSFSWSSYL